jgi:MFS family permease
MHGTPIVTPSAPAWRTPFVVVLCGCLLGMATFGPRSALGLFTTPYTIDRGFSLELFSFAMAVQNLLWGAGQPFAGGLADRFGTVRVLTVGLLLYAGGLALMAIATDPLTLSLGAGVMIGFGLSGSAFNLVISALGKIVPEEKRGLAFGLATAAGSFGQFLFAPLAAMMIRDVGWQPTLFVFAAILICVVPLSFALATQPGQGSSVAAGAADESFRDVLARAFGHRSYLLLVAGFFVCGFHLAFITIHLPKYLVEKGLDPIWGGWTLALIGLFNIAGSLGSGLIMNRYPKRYLLAWIYLLRSVAIVAFVTLPVTPLSALAFGASIGILWLSTIPPTSSLVAIMFGTRWMGMLYGVVFFSHQVGSFVGLVLAGWTYAATGTYDLVWWIGILLGLFAAIVHLPIVEKPVAAAPRTA